MTISENKGTWKKILALQGDKVLWTIFFILIAVSWIEVYSATSTLTFKSGNLMKPILGHSLNLIVGIVCVWVFHNIPCRWFKLWVPLWVLFNMLLVFLPIFGEKVNDGARWISIMGIPFQPSEFAKGALVVVVSVILAAYQTRKGTDRHAFKYIMWATAITCGLIFVENFSTAGILFAVIFLMMFIGRVPLAQLGKLLAVLVGLVILLVLSVKMLPTEKIVEAVPALHRIDNFKSRIDRFSKNKQNDAKRLTSSTKQTVTEDFDINKEPQVGHAHIAIAKSNILGCGPGNSRERDFLPQAYSDFIFAIIIEELGLIGGAVIVFLYIVLLFRACRIANRCERSFPAFVIMGLSLLIVVQAAVNMCVAVGLTPVTGQPLPLVSRGGSSIMVTSIYFGMMISVSRFAKKRDTAANNSIADNDQSLEPAKEVINEEEFMSTDGMN